MSPEGYMLTNNHVVDGATDVKVTLSDKREYKAQVIGTDPKTDIAVLKLTGEKFNAITLGDSTKVQVGDYALAIGDPFGVGPDGDDGHREREGARQTSASRTTRTSSRPMRRSIRATRAERW